MAMKAQRFGQWLAIVVLLAVACNSSAQQTRFVLHGTVIDAATREEVPGAVVRVEGQPGVGSVADTLGRFVIRNVAPGIYRLRASSVGYAEELTPEYRVSEATPAVQIELTVKVHEVDSVTVVATPMLRPVESPVSSYRIGMQQIEKSPGANRDLSRIVQSYPGVVFSPAGYRNDLIVRGGSPAENRFYLDGIEIPNINHFSTQGPREGR